MSEAIGLIPNWFWLIIGFVLGLAVHYYISVNKKDGSIYVTPGNREKPDTYLFEFNVPPEDIPEMRKVIFNVVIKAERDSS